jgi:hypothetical protein
MKQTKAPKSTPSPRKVKQSKEVDKGQNPTSVFISLALDMSWKLAVVVLLPIIAGSVLTNRYNTEWYLLGGIAIALIMAVVVVYQSYGIANNAETKKGSK